MTKEEIEVADFWLKAGDLVPAITSVLRDANGDRIDIKDAVVTFVMRQYETATPIVSGGADNLQVDGDPDTNGIVRYVWQEGDTDIPGGYEAEWQVQFADGRGTVPNHDYKLVAILPSLAAVVGS